MQRQDAVLVARGDGILADALEIERTAERAGTALAVNITVLVGLALIVHVRADGEHTVLRDDIDLILLHARQLRAQLVSVGVFLHVHAECGRVKERIHAEEVVEEVVVQQVHFMVIAVANHHIVHKADLLEIPLLGR